MKKILIVLFVLASAIGFGQTPTYPEKTNRYINDFANVIPDEKEESLAEICKSIETESSSQIVVVTTNDVDKEYPIEDYSIQLARNWGIGQKGVDNGLLILICPDNHKARVEVGYGLEGILTDALTRRMQDKYFKPNFRNGDFYTGIQQILSSIKSTISPEAIQQQKTFAAQKEKESQEAWSNFWDGVLYVIFFGIIAVLLFFGIKKQIEKQRAIKEEEERNQREIERKKHEAELAEQRLIAKAKKFESQIRSKYTEIKSAIISMGDFLNAKEILNALEDIFTIIKSEIEKAKYVDYESIVNEGNKKIDSLCNDILNKFEIRTKVYSFVNNEFPNLKKYEPDFEKTISTTKLNYNTYDKSLWAKGFKIEDCSLERFYITYSAVEALQKEAQNNIQVADFKSAANNIKKAEDQILVLKAYKDSLEIINNKIKTSNDYIQKSFTVFNKILLSIDEAYSHKYVKAKSLHIWKEQKNNITFKLTENYTNPIEEQKRIEDFFKTLESYKNAANSDVQEETARLKRIKDAEDRKRREEEEEERRRRRRREEEEEEERRRRSYSSTSYDSGSSSFGSSSSSSDSGSSSFGGGDFGGGGSSSDW